MADLLIGVDIGTQGIKAALYTLAGECLSLAHEPSQLYSPAAGVVEEDPEFQVASACRMIRRCVKAAGVAGSAIAALALDGQMAGVIGINRAGRHVTPYDSWLDQRCAPQIIQMERQAGDRILKLAGCRPSFNHGPKILRWQRQFKKLYTQITSFVQPAAYVAMRLCGLTGAEAFIDTTYLHFSGFADAKRARWDAGLCELFGLDAARLPRIVEPSEIVGELAPAMARRCGLTAGIPVVAGCGDTAASFLSCGATAPGICVDVAGTASVFAATVTQFKPDLRHKTLACGRAVMPGLWHPYAYVNGGGMNLEWFRRQIVNCGRGKSAQLDFEVLNAQAAALPDDPGAPMFIPHLGGRVCPSQPDLRGAWVGLTWLHTAAHLYRAVMEGVALEYGLYARVLQSLYPGLRLREIRITGGGENSAVWNAIKADCLGLPVVQIAASGGAPMGSALLAGYGAGLFKDLSTAAQHWVRKGRRFRPQRRLQPMYAARLRRYERLLAALDVKS